MKFSMTIAKYRNSAAIKQSTAINSAFNNTRRRRSGTATTTCTSLWQAIHAAECAETELRIQHLETVHPGRVSSFFFGTFVSTFDLMGTPTIGEGVCCHTFGWEKSAPRNGRYRQEITHMLDLADVGVIRARAPQRFVDSELVRNALLFPWWRSAGLMACDEARPIVIDILDPIYSDVAGGLALAMLFAKRGNPVTALVGLPQWRSNTPPKRMGLVDMEALTGALEPWCSKVETYRYPIGRSRRWDQHMNPHDTRLTSVYERLAEL